jgi:hypothetical protein
LTFSPARFILSTHFPCSLDRAGKGGIVVVGPVVVATVVVVGPAVVVVVGPVVVVVVGPVGPAVVVVGTVVVATVVVVTGPAGALVAHRATKPRARMARTEKRPSRFRIIKLPVTSEPRIATACP